MAQSSFQLKLATVPKRAPYDEVPFSHFVKAPGPFGLTDPIVSAVLGDSVDYGHLFAYLFRRFGYPNYGWDNYKDLARYILATPDRELFLQIVPYVGNHTCISFSFLAPRTTIRALERYDVSLRRSWERRALDWQAQQGLPDWMDDWMAFCKELTTRFGFAEPADWRQTVDLMRGGVTPTSDLTTLAARFIVALRQAYHEIEPEPPLCIRAPDWSCWAADDPLKPLAKAAHVALTGLLRPVRVRDNAINAMGPAQHTRVLREPRVAGYPSGALGNAAPQEFARLQGLILQLGKGNARRGISRLLHVAQTTIEGAGAFAPPVPENEGPGL